MDKVKFFRRVLRGHMRDKCNIQTGFYICPVCSSVDLNVETMIFKGAHGYTMHCNECGHLRVDGNVDENLVAFDE